MPIKSSARAIRGVVGPVAVLAAAALTLTACSSSGGARPSSDTAKDAAPAAGSGTAAGNSAAHSDSSTDSSPLSAATPNATGPSSGGVPGAHAAGSGCASSQLKVSRTAAGVGAGSQYFVLRFTNTSGSTCTLTGYPGLSYVAQAGTQSGNAADRDGTTYHTVTLKPGGSAGARVRDANGLSGYSTSTCKLATAQGLRIYPPNQKAALFLPWKTQHCSGSAVHALTVGPVEPNPSW